MYKLLTSFFLIVACQSNSTPKPAPLPNVDTGVYLVTHTDGTLDTLTINGTPYLSNSTFYTVRGTDTVTIAINVIKYQTYKIPTE